MKNVIEQFVQLIKSNKIEIYNEFSFQHELGIYLRNHFPNQKVQFERNVSYFNLDKSQYEKKEIDIAIYSNKNDLTCVMELKFPKNGQVPESMFSFCKDIAFLEQLSKSGFKSAYFIAIADNPLFYLGETKGIYGLFRGQQAISGAIQKPTGKKDKVIYINGSYIAHWKPIINTTKYCLIEVNA